ncbi:sugar phosphate isomerase [Vallitalea longa]|uniref:Sugar phosphate isomerase n=1 Tax=Vallitalea longa TaxID=2936439 RepID=A0A9W6DH49_9FIRM|nr:sugar phosphate isomerase/epimerase [Vallitalea longa]GKX31202.1 sugar phosphate isomerase [Vallitalea longa]
MKNNEIKLGVFNWFGNVMPPVLRVKKIIDAGFDSIMLWWDDELFSEEGKEALTSILSMNINIENIHFPYYECNKIWDDNIEERKYIFNEFTRCISDCDKYNIPIIVMHPTHGHNLCNPNVTGLNLIKDIVNETKKHNIRIALENTSHIYYFKYILDNIKSDYLGVCYDSSHANIYNTSICEVLDDYGDRVIALHLSDNDGCTDKHWLPYCGEIDWTEILVKLGAIRYRGNISLEVFNDKIKDKYESDDFLKEAYKKAVILKNKLEYIL